jgi:aspartyl/glutamyl-tRNA(Asn/Gln) amidotransferase C subunit
MGAHALMNLSTPSSGRRRAGPVPDRGPFGPVAAWPRVPAAPDVQHIARIARLALSHEEAARFAREAASILAHFETIQAAGQGAEPAPLTALEPREDEAHDPDPGQAAAIVAQFPRKAGALAKVPEGL